jgi:uncharacterized protein YlxW (UPF0749 family)
VEDAVGSADFSDAVGRAVAEADFGEAADTAVLAALGNLDLTEPVTRALKGALVRQEMADFVAHLVKRAIAVNFGMVTAETHQEETAQVRDLAAAVRKLEATIEKKDEQIATLQAMVTGLTNDLNAREDEARVAAEYEEMYATERYRATVNHTTGE